jgi:acyl homoserine lactone synthase
MGRSEVVINRKAQMVFPELVPQCELERKPSRRGIFNRKASVASALDAPSARRPTVVPAPDLNIRTTTLSVQNMHQFGELFVDYLKARHEIFVVQKGWKLPETEGMEFDQYDTPLARWIVVHDYGQVLAGVRIAPTTAQCGNHSYMLRDAQLGLLKGLPTDMLYEKAPVANHIWEATRLFVSDSVPSERRLAIQHALMNGMASAAREVHATHVIGIVPAVFKRWLQRMGMTATAVGPVMDIHGDRVQAALMNVIEYAS